MDKKEFLKDVAKASGKELKGAYTSKYGLGALIGVATGAYRATDGDLDKTKKVLVQYVGGTIVGSVGTGLLKTVLSRKGIGVEESVKEGSYPWGTTKEE